jgi:hypothetical protein
MSRRTLLVIGIMLEVPDALLPLKMPNIVILSGSSEVFLDPEVAGQPFWEIVG